MFKRKPKLQKFATSSIFREKPYIPAPRKVAVAVKYPPLASWPPVDKTLEQQLMDATNAHRATLNLSQLVPFDNLIGCSEWKARDMGNRMYMQHDDPSDTDTTNFQTGYSPPFPGRTVADRFADWGFGSVAWGENIAYGFTDVQSVLNAWLSDIGHRENVENPSWTHFGMGVCKASNGLLFWVQDYAVLQVGPKPVVTGISPTSGAVGTNVVITGSNLTNTKSVVFFGANNLNIQAKYTVNNDTNISATVPDGAISDPVVVSTPGGYATTPVFTVTGNPSASAFAQWVNSDYPLLLKSTQYRNWAKNNVNEAAAFKAYVSSPTTPPKLVTPFGQFLVATVSLLPKS